MKQIKLQLTYELIYRNSQCLIRQQKSFVVPSLLHLYKRAKQYKGFVKLVNQHIRVGIGQLG